MTLYHYMEVVGWMCVAVGIVVFVAFVTHHMHQQTKQEMDSAKEISYAEGFDDGFRSGMSALHPSDPVTEVYDFQQHGGI